jgi:hypothetical protein
MNLQLRIVDAGNLEKERVVLTAVTDDDVGQYAVFCCEATEDGKIYSGDIPKVYWFPSQKMKKGDLVVLYTKEGVDSEKKNKSGTTSTFYYWQLDRPLWQPGFRPVLVHTSNWTVGAPIKG